MCTRAYWPVSLGRVGGGDLRALRGGADCSKPPARYPANGEMTVGRDRGFAVVEVLAVCEGFDPQLMWTNVHMKLDAPAQRDIVKSCVLSFFFRRRPA